MARATKGAGRIAYTVRVNGKRKRTRTHVGPTSVAHRPSYSLVTVAATDK